MKTRVLLIAVAMAGCMGVIPACRTRAADLDAGLPARARAEVLLPPDSAALAWRYDMKMASWAGTVAGLVYELNTPALIERRVLELQAQGINTVIINGLHFHHDFLALWPHVVANVKLVTAAAHKHGMRVIFHHDVPVQSYNGTGLHHLLAHADWLQRDIEYDRPTLRCFCIINPEFRRAYFTRITDLARATDIDGVMLDEVTFAGREFCGCAHCRRAFTAVTGLVLPRADTSRVFYNMDDPIWHAWLKWRARAVGDWWVDLRKEFNTVKRDFCIMNYSTHGQFIGARGPLELGVDYVELARGCDFVGTEIMPRNIYDNYRATFAFRKAQSAFGALYRQPVWGLVYHLDDPHYAYFGWAMHQMLGQSVWMDTIAGVDMRHYLDWPGRMSARQAVTMPDVAVLYSTENRNFGRMFKTPPDVLGISQLLTDAHIMHDFILDEDLHDPRKLAGCKLLVLPSAGILSQAGVESVREYVQAGGKLLATAHTSLLDDLGRCNTNFQLSDVMGVDYLEMLNPDGQPPSRVGDAASDITVAGGNAMRVALRAGATADMMFYDAAGAAIAPAVVRNDFGAGQCVYLAFQPGAMNFEMEFRRGTIKTYAKNQPAADLLLGLVNALDGGAFAFRAINIPPQVLVSIHRQPYDAGHRILVHLLNATGAGIKKGEIVPGRRDWVQPGGPFPALPGDLIFELRTDGPVAGYVMSPDYPETRPVHCAAVGAGRWRITVGKDDLRTYSIISLE